MIKEELKSERNVLNRNTWDKLLELGDQQEFNSGDIIFKQDEPAKGLIFFKEGKIKLYTIIPGIMERTICIIEKPCILGEGPVIDGGKNICTAIALAKTKVVSISKEKVQAILLSNTDIMHLIMSILANKIRYMQTQIEDASFRLHHRLARLLICGNEYKISHGGENGLTLIVTHNELASCLGTTRPKVTEHLNKFEKHGLIEKDKGFIKIKDYEGLKNIAGKFCYA